MSVFVNHPVMGGAKRSQIAELVFSPATIENDVMNIEPTSLPASNACGVVICASAFVSQKHSVL
jgi:hypothetical protein